MSRLVIDPVSRVGGHLRVEVEIQRGVVSDAWCAATMYRGLEQVLVGRDPRDAWLLAGRTCGSCVGTHALASVRAAEAALGARVPPNARILRNVIAGTSLIVDHVAGFYQRGLLDWVDLSAALRASPAAAARVSASRARPRSVADLTAVRDRFAASFAPAGPGLLVDRLEGHPAYRLIPEADLLLAAHYLDALDLGRRLARVEAMLGGKTVHPQTLALGGLVLATSWRGALGGRPGEHPEQVEKHLPSALDPDDLTALGGLLAEARSFVDEVLLPDAAMLASRYGEWSRIGTGDADYLAFGDFALDDAPSPALLFPGGRITGGAVARPLAVDPASVTESVAHAWYANGEAGSPAEQGPDPLYRGPALPLVSLDGAERYSWAKAPRYDGQPMEVGPLARLLVGAAQGGRAVRDAVDGGLRALGTGADVLAGALGRSLARAVEAQLVASSLAGWLSALGEGMSAGDLAFVDLSRWDRERWPAKASGHSLGEASRGAVGHWVDIEGGRIARYAIVDGTTWNLSPRDERGRRGPLETALIGTPVADAGRPLELLRVIHSFDPCLACATHAYRGRRIRP